MFNFSDNILDIYVNVSKSYPKYFKARIKGRLSAEMERFKERVNALFMGTLIKDCDPDWLLQKRINVYKFSTLYGSNVFWSKFEEALLLIAKRNITKPIDIIAFSPTTGTSDLIVHMNLLLDDVSPDFVYSLLKEKTQKIIKRVETRSGKSYLFFLMDMYQWYNDNSDRLALLNRGVWELSPFTTFNGFIRMMFGWMISNTPFSVIGGKAWVQFLLDMNKDFHITTKGTGLPPSKVDTDYEHKTIKSPRGRFFEMD